MKKLVPAFMLLIFALAFSGCEMPPEPVKISEVQYSNLTCDQISQEQYRVKAALAAAHDAQRGGSDYGMGGDFNGIHLSSRTGGSSEIDKLREELQALQQAAILKSCPTTHAEPNPYLDDSPKN